MAYTVIECLLGDLLEAARMSKAELARRTGISEGQIYDYIANRTKEMGLANARTIAEALNLKSPYELYEWSPSK